MPMSKNSPAVLVVDDEAQIRRFLRAGFSQRVGLELSLPLFKFLLANPYETALYAACPRMSSYYLDI